MTSTGISLSLRALVALALAAAFPTHVDGTETSSSSSEKAILFRGSLVDDRGLPVDGAAVQFWQTDPTGRYDHPASLADRGGSLDPTFQYFGTDRTDADGVFSFRTYKPGVYPSRPPHVHFKVWVDGEDVLTSQLYFEGESTQPAMLTLTLEEAVDWDGTSPAWNTSKTIAINRGGGGGRPLTPSQTEGPYYPVVDFFEYDNNIADSGDVMDASEVGGGLDSGAGAGAGEETSGSAVGKDKGGGMGTGDDPSTDGAVGESKSHTPTPDQGSQTPFETGNNVAEKLTPTNSPEVGDEIEPTQAPFAPSFADTKTASGGLGKGSVMIPLLVVPLLFL